MFWGETSYNGEIEAENFESSDDERSGSEEGDLEFVITCTREISTQNSSFPDGESSDEAENSRDLAKTKDITKKFLKVPLSSSVPGRKS